MGYCTVNDFKATLAQTLTTGSPNPATLTTPGKLSDLGKQLNLVPPTNSTTGPTLGTYSLADVYFYIRQAQSVIDAALSQQYVVPLRVKTRVELSLLTNIIGDYTASFKISNPELLLPGDQLVLVGVGLLEQTEIESIDDGYITPIDDIDNDFDAGNRVLLIRFPDPIPYICAKLACAMFYDKYAKAQSEPSKSEFAEILRKEATSELNNIREGRTILDNMDRVGSRFVNPNLYSRYGLKGFDDQDGTRSSQDRG